MPGGIYKHNENNFVFEISALSFTDEKSVDYEFYLRGKVFGGLHYPGFRTGAGQ